jgi:transcriptional regulator with XRE-family HTH domain
MSLDIETFSIRLKAARKAAGLTQEALGIAAGIDEFSASARLNQYEKAKHWPDYGTACRIAKVLKIDPAYFYSRSDSVAALLAQWAKASPATKTRLLKELQSASVPGLTG